MDTTTDQPVEEKKHSGAAENDETDRVKKNDDADGDDVNDWIVQRTQPQRKKNNENGSLELVHTEDQPDARLKNHPNPAENPEHVEECITNPRGDDNKTTTPVAQEFGFKGVLSIIPPSISILAFLYDVFTDVDLLVEYYIKGEKIFFYLTLAFLVVPGILVIAVDLTFLYLDYSERKLKHLNDSRGQDEELMDLSQKGGNESISKPEITDSFLKIVARVVLALLSLGIVVRIMQHIYYKYKKITDSTHKEYYKERVGHTKRDYALLSFIFAFTETYAQAALQLYIYTSNPVSLNSTIGRSIITSVAFMPLAFADHYRSMRVQSSEDENKKSDMACIVYIFYFLGVQGAMMFRIVSIALFLAAVPICIGVPLVNLHFVGVFLWLAFYHQPTFEGLLIHRNRCLQFLGKISYLFLYSVTSMLFFVDLYNEKKKDRICFPSKKQDERGETETVPVRSSKWRMLGYNIVLYTESVVFIVFGFYNDNVDLQIYAMVLLTGFLMHVVFIGNYYRFLHPTIGLCYNCTEPEGTKDKDQEGQQPLNDKDRRDSGVA